METKRKSLEIIVNEMLFLERQALDGEEINVEEITDTDCELKDKIDACIYVEGQLESREDFLRKSKALIDQEIKFTQSERKKLRDYMSDQLARLGIKKIMTNLHRVTLRLNDWSLTPFVGKKVKTREELGDVDERCVVEETTYRASRTFAKEILKATDEIPLGFEAERKYSCIYKKGETNGETRTID